MLPEACAIAALIPAAGSSRRMGRDKRLLPLGESTVLEQTVSSLRRGGLSPLIVVLEPDSPCLALAGLRDTLRVVNPCPERGMLSSIREGLAQLPAAAQAVAVLPGDHPFVPAHVVRALAQAFCRERPLLLAPTYAGRRGHPLLIHRALLAEAAACSDAVGLRQLLLQRAADLRELPCDAPGAEADLDRPEDLWRLELAPALKGST